MHWEAQDKYLIRHASGPGVCLLHAVESTLTSRISLLSVLELSLSSENTAESRLAHTANKTNIAKEFKEKKVKKYNSLVFAEKS